MTFVIPTAVHQMQVAHGSDARARGAFAGTLEAAPGTLNTKSQGSLPLTGASATAMVNNQATSATGPLRGVYWEYSATPGYSVGTDTKVVIFVFQINAPNRIQVATLANDGMVFRIFSGSATPPANYRTFQIGGNNVLVGKAREFPRRIVIDLNSDDFDAEVGTWSSTDVQGWGYGTVRFNIAGTSTVQQFFARVFVLDTTKGATNIPRFTGAGSDWDDIITALGTTYSTKISHEWLFKESAFYVDCPIEFGDNSTPTTFNDNGATVFWSNHADPTDPRVRVTNQAFRVYLNLRNNAADTATFSGTYDAGDSNPLWDFDQDDAAVVTFDSPTFKRTGQFDIGSSITGPATWDGCGPVVCQDAGSDLDGSTYKNPLGDHLLDLTAL